jgi:isopentenyl-diphosphate delta-isomerase
MPNAMTASDLSLSRDRSEQVILVDADDNALGTAGKLEAHRAGALHRAFSIFLFSSDGRILLQQRAATKYHSGGLWANACCGHPRPGESVPAAASRRLFEELGLRVPLVQGFAARYRATLDGGMTENEIAHMLFGATDDTPRPDPAEVARTRRVDPETLSAEIDRAPHLHTAWLLHYLRRHDTEIMTWRSLLTGALV